jgi:NAD(P)-dependent dehydrogenase (short-subunit alcohol dehydrogenase family)
MVDLAASVAIVTGASSGIGLGLAEMLARHGVRVALAA